MQYSGPGDDRGILLVDLLRRVIGLQRTEDGHLAGIAPVQAQLVIDLIDQALVDLGGLARPLQLHLLAVPPVIKPKMPGLDRLRLLRSEHPVVDWVALGISWVFHVGY